MKARPAFLSALFVAILFGGLAKAQEGPKDVGDYVLMSKAEAQRVYDLMGQAAALIAKQAKDIEKLKASLGCT